LAAQLKEGSQQQQRGRQQRDIEHPSQGRGHGTMLPTRPPRALIQISRNSSRLRVGRHQVILTEVAYYKCHQPSIQSPRIIAFITREPRHELDRARQAGGVGLYDLGRPDGVLRPRLHFGRWLAAIGLQIRRRRSVRGHRLQPGFRTPRLRDDPPSPFGLDQRHHFDALRVARVSSSVIGHAATATAVLPKCANLVA
jgi:hypothetical protein